MGLSHLLTRRLNGPSFMSTNNVETHLFVLFCFCVLAILPTNWTSLACEFTVSRHVEDLYDVLVVGFWSPLHEDVAKTVTLTPKIS